MLRDGLILMLCGAGSYLWLCANASPLVSSGRSLLRYRADRTAWAAFALASSGAALWTAIAAGAIVLGAIVLGMSAGPGPLPSDLIWRGVSLGNIVWVCQLLAFARVPRLGPTFETATALAMVAIVNDDPWRLSRVERLYRAHALADVPGAPVVSGPVVANARGVAA